MEGKINLRHRFLVHKRPLQCAIHVDYLFAFDTRRSSDVVAGFGERVRLFHRRGFRGESDRCCGKPSSLDAMSLRARIRGRGGEWYRWRTRLQGVSHPVLQRGEFLRLGKGNRYGPRTMLLRAEGPTADRDPSKNASSSRRQLDCGMILP
jgi:hypothetical protein